MNKEANISNKYIKTLFEKSLNSFARKYGIEIAQDIKNTLCSQKKGFSFIKKYGKEKGTMYLENFCDILEIKRKTIIQNPFRMGETNKCEMCNYEEDPEVLHIHHLRPELKKEEIANFLKECKESKIADWKKWFDTYSDYWITVCQNCHKRIELGRFPKWKNRQDFLSWKIKQEK